MCAELGVAKEKKTIIKGSHKFDTMQEVLDSFITKFVLCPKCHLPEINLFEEKKILKGACRACGKVAKLDNTHKISSYIVKNIPKNEGKMKTEFGTTGQDYKEGSNDKKVKKGKKDKDKKKGKKEEEENEEEDKKGKFWRKFRLID